MIPMPIVVDLHTRGGEVYSQRCEVPTGHPRKALGWSGVEAKVRDCAGWGTTVCDDAVLDQLISAIRHLESEPDTGRVMGLLSRARPIP
jgi:2-methylcitrate dehydratase PrpD